MPSNILDSAEICNGVGFSTFFLEAMSFIVIDFKDKVCFTTCFVQHKHPLEFVKLTDGLNGMATTKRRRMINERADESCGTDSLRQRFRAWIETRLNKEDFDIENFINYKWDMIATSLLSSYGKFSSMYLRIPKKRFRPRVLEFNHHDFEEIIDPIVEEIWKLTITQLDAARAANNAVSVCTLHFPYTSSLGNLYYVGYFHY
ncbi:hypothetical protein F5884DRAFT_814956 [Xylogone sp. PMI_703]|nr:hypothetical protein F5884DRAFT_814956 [Xylogone sp. PMI_703]